MEPELDNILGFEIFCSLLLGKSKINWRVRQTGESDKLSLTILSNDDSFNMILFLFVILIEMNSII